MKEEKREATSIKIRPQLWKDAKIEAIKQGMTVSELVEEAIDCWIQEKLMEEQKTKRK